MISVVVSVVQNRVKKAKLKKVDYYKVITATIALSSYLPEN